MAQETNTSLPSHEMIMVIAEEHDTLRTMFDGGSSNATFLEGERHFLKPSVKQALGLRSRYNPGLYFYIVHCDQWISYGMDADDIFDLIETAYNEHHCKVRISDLFEGVEML